MIRAKHIFFLILSLFFSSLGFTQVCTTLGQTPASAFPVCGTTNFHQQTVPICGLTPLFVPGCTDGANYMDTNPFWYKFTCYQSGTLGFLITPNDPNDDYDWQLYDITGLPPEAVFSNHNIIVTGNWAGTYGTTGTAAGGLNYIHCASDPAAGASTFAAMPNLVQGHQYLLLVSHFTQTQSGYSLSFNGGSAIITDPKLPLIKSAVAPCDGTKILVTFNKDIKCNTLAVNGSDFRLNIPGASIIAANAAKCSSSFDFDSLELTVNMPLPPGTHTLYAKIGTDNNTLKDNCDHEINVDDSVQFTVYPLYPTPMDSIVPVSCAPQTVELVFRKRMMCNSIAADGSDFTITGPSPILITGARGNCENGLSFTITLTLDKPIQKGGVYTVHLKNGSDGNPILDECAQATLVPSSLNFIVKDTVNADFSYHTNFGCAKNQVAFFHNGQNGITQWLWNFDNIQTSMLQNPVKDYYDFNPKNVKLIVTNGVCSDTAEINLVFNNYMKASFEITSLVCPGEKAIIKNQSVSNSPLSWNWNFNYSSSSTLQNPPPQIFTNNFPNTVIELPVTLVISNAYGCYDTATQYIKVINNCFIAVPAAFTPNGDGLNDYFYPLNAYKANNLQFAVYNRLGQQIFYTTDWTQKWDGRFKGNEQDPGTYVWTLRYVHADTKKLVEQKGTVILIR